MHIGNGLPKVLALLCVVLIITLTSATTAHADGPVRRIIIQHSAASNTPKAAAIVSQAVIAAGNRHGVSLTPLRSVADGARVMTLKGELTRDELKKLLDELKTIQGVAHAEEDILMQPLLVPNDPRYNEQWHYFEPTGGINLPNAWDQSTGSGVMVAVVDTGYLPHPDVAANIVGGYDFISDSFIANDGGGRDNDATDPGDGTFHNQCGPETDGRPSSWHGSTVSGVVAARTNNSIGGAGVAYNARIVPARALGRCGGFTSDIVDAIVWASGGSVPGVPANPNPARVVNLSLGGESPCPTSMQNAINSARSRGAVVVAAAGNGLTGANFNSPANCAGVITVTGTGRAGGRAHFFISDFESYDASTGTVVDLAAPAGETNFTTQVNGVLTTHVGSSYAFVQGTSYSAPHVSGVAALMLSANFALTPDQVESMLKSTARPFPATCNQCGTGILNAAAAVNAATAVIRRDQEH